MRKDSLEDYWSHKKALSPAAMVKTLFREEVLNSIRRELNLNAPARLDLQDVFNALKEVLTKEAILQAGDIGITKRRKRRKKVLRVDNSTGQTVTEEVEVDDDQSDDEDGAGADTASGSVSASDPSGSSV